MSSLHQLQTGQPEIDTVQAEIQRAEQDLVAAKQLGDGAEVAFLRKKLEQLREEKLEHKVCCYARVVQNAG